ncbi:hypothetical protein O3P69_010185 [Scylla paramamosain]|uniref:MADF domain-containing protein n=1 Tax=Scylla paramamosain TaxID=85552 RepID=A0AAW0TVU6_SCYPA
MERNNIVKLVDMKVSGEDLISEVEQHAAIWDPAVEEYGNRADRRLAWNAVIRAFFPDFDDMPPAEKNGLTAVIQRRWKGIRTCYARELQRQKQEKDLPPTKIRRPYIHFEALQFLESVSKQVTDDTKGEATNTSLDESCKNLLKIVPTQIISSTDECTTAIASVDTEDKDVEEISLKDKEAKKQKHKQSFRRKIASKEDDELIHTLMKKIIRCENMSSENNEDRLFLLSLTSELHKVPEDRKLKLKGDIITLISQAQQSVSHGKRKLL